jgi:hypothetical protein
MAHTHRPDLMAATVDTNGHLPHCQARHLLRTAAVVSKLQPSHHSPVSMRGQPLMIGDNAVRAPLGQMQLSHVYPLVARLSQAIESLAGSKLRH